MQSFRARVTAVRDLTRDVRQIGLTLVDPPGIRFAAGQFVSFEIDRAGSPFPATRPYSIASSPRERTSIELAFNRVPEGPGSSYLFGLQNGDDTTFKGPVGSFILRDNERDVLFVATGTGIAPIRSMLWALADAGSTRRITLVPGTPKRTRRGLRGRAGGPSKPIAAFFIDDNVVATGRELARRRGARCTACRQRHHERRESRRLFVRKRFDDPRRP